MPQKKVLMAAHHPGSVNALAPVEWVMPSRCSVRQASPGDLDSVISLYHRLFRKEQEEFHQILNLYWLGSSQERKFFERLIVEKNSIVLVAECEGKIIGYALGAIQRRVPQRVRVKYAELESMFVAEKFGNQGIGKRLIEAFSNWCRTKKVAHIFISASAGNEKAIRLYRRLGFQDYSLVLKMAL